MIELNACALKSKDEFTTDNGETWHVVKVVRDARRGTRTVVITDAGKELILKSDQPIIVKLK